MNSRLSLSLLVAVFTVQSVFVRADDTDAPTYEKHIAPFLKTYCLGCHDGGDDSKGGLSVLTYKALMQGGDGGEVVESGKSNESRLLLMVLGKEKPRMPPKDSKQPRAEEIDLVKRWIDAGARGPTVSVPQSAGDLDVPAIKPKRQVMAAISALAYSPDGKWLAAARDRDVLLIEPGTGTISQALAGAESPINSVAFSPDSRLVAAGEGLPGVVGKVRLWEIGKAEPSTFTGHADSIYSVAFSPNGKLLATASYDKLLMLWNVAEGTEQATLKHHTGAVFGAAFNPDGKTLASAAADQTIKLWNVATAQRVATLTEPTKGLNAVAFSPRGTEFIAVGIDKMIRTYEWNGTAAKLKRSTFAHDAPILAAVYSPDGKTLFTASEDRRVKAWDAATLRERHVYDHLPDWPLCLAVNRDGTQLATGFFSGELSLFDVNSPQKVRDILTKEKQVGDVRGSRADAGSVSRGANPAITLVAATVGQNAAAQEPAEQKPNPPMPRLDAVSPRTVVRGNKVTLTLSGPGVHDADRLFVQPAHLKATLLPKEEKKNNQRQCEIEIPADMQPGLVKLRLHSPLGSTEAKSFYVGPFAEIAEKEDNNTRDKATVGTLPATLSGTIGAKGDRDLWAFESSGDQELAFILLGPHLGSALNARLSLLDAAGKTVIESVRVPYRNEVVLLLDPAVGLTGRLGPGRYSLQVEDRNFTGGGNHFYYILAGRISYVTEFFPLALRSTANGERGPGEVDRIVAQGINFQRFLLTSERPGITIQPPATVGTQLVPLDTDFGKTFNVVRFEASPFAEFAEYDASHFKEIVPNNSPDHALHIPVPCGVSGTIAYPRVGDGAHAGTLNEIDVDHFAFNAKKGDRLTLEVFARRLGSPLDSVLDILSADGKPVAQHTLRPVSETYTVLRDHDSRSKGIRLQAWDDMFPGDLIMLGGELAKIQFLPLGPDEDVKFFDKGAMRLGYLGSTPEAHALNSAAYKVEVHPPGTSFPPNGMPVTELSYRNDDGGPGFGSDSVIYFDVPADGKYVARLRDVRGLSGYRNDFFYRLVIRPRQQDFRLSLDIENPDIPRGGSLPVTVELDRLDGFNGYVDVRVEGLPPGITATRTRIGPDLFNGILTLSAEETAPQPAGDESLSMRVIATAVIDGRTVEHTTTPSFGGHQLTITSPPDLHVQVEPAVAAIAPGEQKKFSVTIERRNAFKGRVPVEVLNLPHGVRVQDVGLNGVLINENETTRSFIIACDPWAIPDTINFYAAGKVETKKERHAAPAIRLEIRPARSVAGK